MQVDPVEQLAVVERFLDAVSTGDLQGLMDVLAPDVVAIADGGGVAPALGKPLVGARKLAAAFARFANMPTFVASATWLNALPGVRLDFGDLTAVMSFVVEDGLITRVYAINNPQKLERLETVAELRR
jgi:RNA polymerase sigma-70 factor (ECF subfamily)